MTMHRSASTPPTRSHPDGSAADRPDPGPATGRGRWVKALGTLAAVGTLGTLFSLPVLAGEGASWSAATTAAESEGPLCADAWAGAGSRVDVALHVRNETDEPARVLGARVRGAENLTVQSLGVDRPWLEPGGRLEPGVPGSPGPLGPMHVTVGSASEDGLAFRLLRAPAMSEIPAHGSVTLVADARVADPDRPATLEGLELEVLHDGDRKVLRSTVPVVVEPGGASLPAACGV